MIASHKSIP